MDPPLEFYGGDPTSRSAPQRRSAKVGKPASQQQQQPQFGYQQPMYGGGSTQLFDDTSQYSDPAMSQSQGHMGQPAFMGSQLVNDPMANMALQYGSSLASTGREFVDQKIDHFLSVSKLKYYFAVDTNYVIKKLALLVFPFTHQNWSVKYNKTEPVAPRYEINAPDLYIPVMAFVTYVLTCGLVLGTQNRFSPEQLGMTASSALVWLFVELLVIIMTLYVFGMSSDVRYLDMLAFCGYKYVGMIMAAIVGLILKSTGYYVTIAWMSFTTSFFLARTLRLIILPEAASDGVARASKRRLYLLLFISLVQPVFMFMLTRHLNQFETGTITNLKV